MSGWIKTHRSLQKWEWYTAPNMMHLFFHLIINANYEATRWRGIELKRGQLIVGRKKLSIDTGISERSIRTCLKRLKESKEIIIKTTKAFSIVTICNYDKYQDGNRESDQPDDQPDDQRATNERPTSDQRATTVKEVNKYKKDKKSNKKEDPLFTQTGGPSFTILQKQLFDSLFDIYPNQQSKIDGMWAFVKLNRNIHLVAEIKKSIQGHMAYVWKDPDFIPKFATFINKRLFEDNLTLNGELGNETMIESDHALVIQPADVIRIGSHDYVVDDGNRVMTSTGIIPEGMLKNMIKLGQATQKQYEKTSN